MGGRPYDELHRLKATPSVPTVMVQREASVQRAKHFWIRRRLTTGWKRGTRLLATTASSYTSSSSSSSHFCAGQLLTPHNRTLEVRPGRNN